ncbi:MAG: AI-2E family transporter, partial [Aliifodinibius sp.]|nr:AI-2E family transporter [Fodinibius sp.]NIV15521.1 AI-2E family transporter [Fodinibius sp.]NIY29372.1 AI-2E family transporter [Fodinibius sp.]
MAKIVLPEISVWSTSRIILATLIVLLIAAGFWLLYQIRWVVFIFFIAVVIGTALKPVVDWLRRQGVPQILSMVLVYVLLLVILIGFVVLLVPTLVEQGV